MTKRIAVIGSLLVVCVAVVSPVCLAADSGSARDTDTLDLKFHLTISAINLAVIFLLAFIFLYSFHLRDKRNARYSGVWSAIGDFFGYRYGAVWLLNMFTALAVSNFVSGIAGRFVPGLVAMLAFFLLFTPAFLWYPLHLREKNPAKYRGTWKRIGDWLGGPRLSTAAPGS